MGITRASFFRRIIISFFGIFVLPAFIAGNPNKLPPEFFKDAGFPDWID